ncbi:unnamed protein product [Penicillium camemberti]|uniref:Str. FM013 n=1 Tax=Penicillium camemberti (strain FM 013) TaxID=1429867 RepID=A0A0G4PRH8_PENC3|nr:unnamed protein product [Penicillium camemberti]
MSQIFGPIQPVSLLQSQSQWGVPLHPGPPCAKNDHK